MDHILPRSRAGGGDELDNLAAACFPCNRLKWHRTVAEDPLSGEIVRLFHPRTDRWEDHFAWSPDFLDVRGRTAIGRATVWPLRFGRADRRRQRRVLRAAALGGGPAWP